MNSIFVGRFKNKPYLKARIVITIVSILIMICFADDMSLWHDDIGTIHMVSELLTPKDIIYRLSGQEANSNPPLFYIIAYFWLRLAPYGTFWLKLPSIIFSVIGIWIAGTAACYIRNDRTALICTIFLTTSWFLINYAAFTFRCYGLLFMLCSILIKRYYLRLSEPKSLKNQLLYSVVLCLLLYTHYYCVLIFGILCFFDFVQVYRKRIKLYNLCSYLLCVFMLIPWAFLKLKDIVESKKEFWPGVPTFTSLIKAVRIIFSEHSFVMILFLIGVVIPFVVVLFQKQDKLKSIKREHEFEICLMMALWTVFVIAFSYLYSSKINPKGSVFCERYFICVLSPVCVVASVGLDNIIDIITDSMSLKNYRISVISIILSIYLITIVPEIIQLESHAGTVNEPIEQTVEWIYNHEYSRSTTTATITNTYQDGLYYYGSHHFQRENLVFIPQFLNEDVGKYKYLFVAPMHGRINDGFLKIINDNYTEVERNNELSVTVYERTTDYMEEDTQEIDLSQMRIIPKQTGERWIGDGGMYLSDYQIKNGKITFDKNENKYILSGWAIDYLNKNDLANLLIFADDKQIRCQYGLVGTDVGEYFQISTIQNCRFNCTITKKYLEENKIEKLRFIMLCSDGESYYEPIDYYIAFK